jgi:hypothetical protein
MKQLSPWSILFGLVAGAVSIGCGGGSGSGGGGIIQPTNPLSQGLVHEWKLNGNANDSVGDLSTAPIGPVSYTASPIGTAMVFNGSSTGINLSPVLDMQFQQSFTLSAWAYLKSYPTSGQIWSSIIFEGDDRQGLDPYGLLVAPDGTLHFLTTSTAAAGAISAAQNFPLNTWVFVTGTYDKTAGLQTIYVDGVLSGQNKNVTNLTPVVPLDPSQYPGIGIGTGNEFLHSSYHFGWNGALADVRAYNRALSSSEVMQLYNLRGSNL